MKTHEQQIHELASELGTLRAQVERQQAVGQVAPLGYINAGHLHEMQQGRLPYAYLYPTEEVGASVPVYTTPAPSPTPVAQEAADTGADELRNALQCLLASGGAIAEATAGELQSAIADPQAAPIVKNQAAAVLRARAALAASTGANVDAGMVMLTPLQYNQIPELCAISPRLYESIVRAIEAEFCRINGLTVGGIQASGRVGK